MIILFKIIERIKNFFFKLFLKIKYGKRVEIGRNVIFRKKVNITIEKSGKLIIGDNTFFNNDCSINCMNKIKIGKNNLFGECVKIYDHDHKINTKNRSHKFNFGNIEIGDNNWVCSDCKILRKAAIGDNNVISCNSIINEKIGSNKLIKTKIKYEVEEIKYKEG